MIARVPAEVFPPGEFLRDELEARGWSQSEFAEILGRPHRVVNEIIAGKRQITPETAKEMAAALGTSPEFWMNLEAAYRLRQTDPAPARIERRAKLRERYPVRDMVKRGWILKGANVDELEANVFSFFDVSSLEETPAMRYAARQTTGQVDLTPLQEAWLFRVKQIAEAMPVVAYSELALRNALSTLRGLLGAAEEARKIPAVLAECGVRFVVVEPLPASKIDGVSFWLGESPVLGMTLRFDRIDNLWFVLRHEIEHILRRDAAVVDVDLDGSREDVSEQERIANAAAVEFCVPQAELTDFLARVGPLLSVEKVEGFAARLGIHPGLVVGQLHWRFKRYDLFRKHLAKVRDTLTSAAMTDGYGHALPVTV